MRPKPIVDGKLYCVDCRAWRPASEFRKRPNGRHFSYCNDCRRKRNRDSYYRRLERDTRPDTTLGPNYHAGGIAPYHGAQAS